MPTIPLYQFTPRPTGPGNVTVDPTMLSGQYRAAASVGRAIAQVGDVAMSFAERKQDAINYGQMADADRQMKEANLLFEDELKTEGDESKWGQLWSKRADSVEKTILSKDAAPAIRPQLTEQLRTWKTLGAAQVQQQATTRQIERSKAQVIDSAEMELKLGNIGAYKAKIGEGAGKGLFSPEESRRMIAQAEEKADWFAAYGIINEDPGEALEMLGEKTEGGRYRNFANLDESQRYSLTQSARGALNAKRIETQESIFNRRQSGEVIGDAELNQLVESRVVKPEWAKAFKAQQLKDIAGAQPKAGQFAEVLSDIASYDPVADGGRVAYAQIYEQAMLLPDRMATDAVARLKEQADPESPMNGPAAKSGMEIVNGMFNAGVFGEFKVTSINMTTGTFDTKTDPAKYQQALEGKAKAIGIVSAFVKRKPDATYEEVLAELGRATSESRIETGAAVFRSPETLILRQQSEADDAEARLESILQRYPTP